jgi:hypothetical protein
MAFHLIEPLRPWHERGRRLAPLLCSGNAPVVGRLLRRFIWEQAQRRRRNQGPRAWWLLRHRHRCRVCGRDFYGGHAARICEAAWCLLVVTMRRHAAHRRGTRPGRCEGCGAPFPTRRNTARYCRPACRQRAYRQRATLINGAQNAVR